VVPAAGIDGAGRFVAIDADAPSRIATLAARHDQDLRVTFEGDFGATT
jgi:hypothetical protein